MTAYNSTEFDPPAPVATMDALTIKPTSRAKGLLAGALARNHRLSLVKHCYSESVDSLSAIN